MPERVLLVGLGLKSVAAAIPASLAELEGLALTAGAEIVGIRTQALPRWNSRTLAGTGKIEEIAAAVREHKVQTVIFDAELSASQQKAIEGTVPAKVVDRTRLILDIFAQRAHTREGRMQVELAQLSYLLPRLTGAWRSFSQQVGGIGTRGPGEQKLEYERRHIQRRILELREKIESVKRARAVRRQARLSVPIPQIAIIGYTNAGKSTLLNTLAPSASPIYADDKLFATLDPTARRVKIPGFGWAVATDTVGFIQRLPTTLVAAFRSTLEELTMADCLLFLSGASSPNREMQERTVASILDEMGARDIPLVSAFSKADAVDAETRRALVRKAPLRPMISSRTGEGLDKLYEALARALSERWILKHLYLPFSEASRLGMIRSAAQVVSVETESERMKIGLRITQANWDRLLKRMDALPGVESGTSTK
jgi:GTP-binding protein HflX